MQARPRGRGAVAAGDGSSSGGGGGGGGGGGSGVQPVYSDFIGPDPTECLFLPLQGEDSRRLWDCDNDDPHGGGVGEPWRDRVAHQCLVNVNK